MTADTKTALALAGLALAFVALRSAFLEQLWGRPAALAPVPLADPAFTNTAPVRTTLADLLAKGADTSDYDCYTCHEAGKAITLRFDTNNAVILPKEHADLRIRHGRNDRNDNCYNCHDPAKLDQLLRRDGGKLKLQDSTPLCAGCHGPTYRDWEIGIHGRVSGYWDRRAGQASRLACVSCHDPHAPFFAPLKPAPGPHLLHPPLLAAGPHPAND
ncbi:MAG: hypothetical protein KGS61_19075 [Verrucomicrobia bacterium]|nr:hypothetical protein [Verrucomicrobiota bacterium]